MGHVTKTAIFENSRWRTATILKIALSSYLSRELSDSDQIWYAEADFYIRGLLFDKKSKFCKFKMADGRHIEILFGYIPAPYWPINANFGSEMNNHMRFDT